MRDSLLEVSLYLLQLDYNIECSSFKIMSKKPIFTAREIIAFEVDSSLTNDVESFSEDNEDPLKRTGKMDRINLINGLINLLKYEIGNDRFKKISEFPLTKFKNIKNKIIDYQR